MYPILKKFSNLFIVLAIIGFICSFCIFYCINELQLIPDLWEAPFIIFSLLFTTFSGPTLFTCLAIVFRVLHQDLGNANYATTKRISDLKNKH